MVSDVYQVQLRPARLREIDRRPGGEGSALQPVGRQQYLLRKAVRRKTLSTLSSALGHFTITGEQANRRASAVGPARTMKMSASNTPPMNS